MLPLYSNIKSRRKELHMTQTELAAKVGYSDKSMISLIEKGGIDIPQSKIVEFAKALDTTPSELMGWEDEPDQDDVIDITAELNNLLTRIEGGKSISIHGKSLDDNTKELLTDSLTNTLKLINAISKNS